MLNDYPELARDSFSDRLSGPSGDAASDSDLEPFGSDTKTGCFPFSTKWIRRIFKRKERMESNNSSTETNQYQCEETNNSANRIKDFFKKKEKRKKKLSPVTTSISRSLLPRREPEYLPVEILTKQVEDEIGSGAEIIAKPWIPAKQDPVEEDEEWLTGASYDHGPELNTCPSELDVHIKKKRKAPKPPPSVHAQQFVQDVFTKKANDADKEHESKGRGTKTSKRDTGKASTREPPSTSKREPSTSKCEPTTSTRESTTSTREQSTSTREQSTSKREPSTSNNEPITPNRKSSTSRRNSIFSKKSKTGLTKLCPSFHSEVEGEDIIVNVQSGVVQPRKLQLHCITPDDPNAFEDGNFRIANHRPVVVEAASYRLGDLLMHDEIAGDKADWHQTIHNEEETYMKHCARTENTLATNRRAQIQQFKDTDSRPVNSSGRAPSAEETEIGFCDKIAKFFKDTCPWC